MINKSAQGFAAPTLIAVVMSVSFIAAMAFGFWAFAGMQENKSNLEKKIAAASKIAVEKAESAKEAEFAEREKDPFNVYRGSETYGSVVFRYPRTWSVYLEERTSGTVLDFYAQPFFVNGTDASTAKALRAQIISNSYSRELDSIKSMADKGRLTVKAFRPKKVPEVLGIYASGEVATEKQGAIIILPLRDKTLIIWTESQDYVKDFNRVIETLSFVP